MSPVWKTAPSTVIRGIDLGQGAVTVLRCWPWFTGVNSQHANSTPCVCHFPPGTSKWNNIEHRLFSAITLNWRGRPLTSHEVIVKTIASTRTRCGLRVEATLDTRDYPIGVSISKQRFAALPLKRHPTESGTNRGSHAVTGRSLGAASSLWVNPGYQRRKSAARSLLSTRVRTWRSR